MTMRRPQAPSTPRHRRARAWPVALLLTALATAPAAAAPARFELDPVHTRVVFAVSHAGFSQALGAVSGSTGTLEFDPEDWSGARLQVSVPLQRLDLGDAEWNRAALARNLLDAERWPEARFVSTRVEPLEGGRFIVHGQLTLRGITVEVPLEVKFNALKRHPLPPFRRTAGFSATATLSRSAFGIDAWPSVIGDQVQLRIEAEAVRGARPGEEAREDAPEGAVAPGDDVPAADGETRPAVPPGTQPGTQPESRQEPAKP